MTRCHIEEQEIHMPKPTFFNLPAEKQATLIEAAKDEFSRAPLHEASIANIVKQAGIPRGSFYQYFEDKDDLYYHLLTQIAQRNHERFVYLLKEKDGDLFSVFAEFFRIMIHHYKDQKNNCFFRNTYLNMNYRTENTLANHLYEEKRRSQYLESIHLINTSNLNLQDEEELHHVIKIIIAVTTRNLIEMFTKDLSEEEALQRYLTQIELLKRGLYKENL